jgi:hypothetical protein
MDRIAYEDERFVFMPHVLHAACSSPCYISMSMLHVLAACPCQLCMLCVHVYTVVYFHGHGHGTRTRTPHGHPNEGGHEHSIILRLFHFHVNFKIPAKQNHDSVKISGSCFSVEFWDSRGHEWSIAKNLELRSSRVLLSHKDWWIWPL